MLEAEWIEATLTATLDAPNTHLRLIARSMKSWTQEVTAKGKAYERTLWLDQKGRVNLFTLRAEQKSYYYMICSTNRQFWAAFLPGVYEVVGESKRYCTALRYTKPLSFFTTTTVRDTEGSETIALEEKKDIVHRAVFSHPAADLEGSLLHSSGRAHQRVNETTLRKALLDWS